jgi:3-hydroxy-2-methylpyridine-4,5-dicarboxylate 4-decarboxylase
MSMMMNLESYKGVARTAKEAIEQVVLANRILANEGVLDAFGHVSVRHPKNPNTFLQSRSLSPELVTKDDILEIDLDGNVLTKTDMRPYGERIIHAAVLKARPDVMAVFHGHPHSVIPFTCTGVPIRPVVHFGSMFYEGINLYDDYDVSSGMLIASPEEGERVARVLGDKRALLMRGHGCVVVGESAQRMVMGAIYLRDNAAIQFQAMQLGQPKYLSYEEGRQANINTEAALVVERAWSYWVGRAKKAMPDLSP